jgi:hypothetical protein
LVDRPIELLVVTTVVLTSYGGISELWDETGGDPEVRMVLELVVEVWFAGMP